MRGIKGVFLANQKVDSKVRTLITFNNGRDWELLTPPTVDMNGKAVNCKQVEISKQILACDFVFYFFLHFLYCIRFSSFFSISLSISIFPSAYEHSKQVCLLQILAFCDVSFCEIHMC